ncbi:Crp/Fnr family transcriptional regulator [Chondromyces crocatus]|uniref:cAMP phosphodiesterase n=1 Tax=Chondromyces crocatus TaxID=52 RepID=A0A0K1EQY5_CHOCO|nr:Crp/Fnr family transcriptional regulator [Chondromyces crocatus]AKT43340.1 cAMP phosphodiesterase [Chondromyces crocatus]
MTEIEPTFSAATDADPRRSPSEASRLHDVSAGVRLSFFFDKAATATRNAVMAAATSEIVPGGTAIFDQDTPVDTLVSLGGRGRARIERVLSGGVIPLGYRGSGDLLGESCLGGHEQRTERAVAMEEAEIVRIPVALARELLARDPDLGHAVVSVLISRQREVEDRIESMLFRNVEGRLAEFLISAADRWGVSTPRGVLISAPLTHFEIAQVIGSTRETVTLTLGMLRREGILDVAGRRLILRERDALVQRASRSLSP